MACSCKYALYQLQFAILLASSTTLNFPYSSGPFKVSQFKVTPGQNGSPLITNGFYPEASNGSFPAIFFVGGVAGAVPAEAYTDLLTRVSSHGYVVLGMDKLALETRNAFPVSDGVEKFLRQTEWLREYVTTTLHMSWNTSIAMCQSEGCDVILNMILNSTDIAKAAVYIDPFSLTSKRVSTVANPIPSLMTVSELSEVFPACCVKGFGYRRFYELVQCPKVKMDIKDFGHCDLLDNQDWQLCHKTKVCVTTNNTRNDDYKDFLTGLVTSFLQWTLFGNQSMERYVTDSTTLPLPVTDLAYNLTCTP